MSKRHPGLVRRGDIFYVRKRVPADVETIVGRKEINHSLKTSDKNEAEARYW